MITDFGFVFGFVFGCFWICFWCFWICFWMILDRFADGSASRAAPLTRQCPMMRGVC